MGLFFHYLKMCSHRASASASVLTLRKDIIDLQLYYSDRMTLAMVPENGSQTVADLGGGGPYGPKFSRFHAVFQKI